MKNNVGGIDKIARLVIGLVIAALGVLYQSWWGLLAIIPLFTSAAGWCPLYLPFGLSTCKTKAEAK